MKNKINILGVALMTLVCLGSCEKTYVEPISPAAPAESKSVTDDEAKGLVLVSRIMITKGLWRISSFQLHDRDDNDRFKGYIFKFGENGVLTAVHRNVREQGKWGREKLAFNINFGDLVPLNELNNNKWMLQDHTANYFELKGISPYDSSSEFLLFERISI